MNIVIKQTSSLLDLTSLSSQLSTYARISYPSSHVTQCNGELTHYKRASWSYNLAYNSDPKAVITCKTTNDVAVTVKFFYSNGASFRIRSSGHNLAGYSGASCSQYLIDLSNMTDIIRQNDNITTFQPGVRSDMLFHFLQEYREVIVSCAPSVHASGMIMAGGLSELSAIQGTSTDLATEIEMVLYNGSVVTASSTINSDLFFALRGAGGGNFGVLTKASISAIPVPSSMAAGKYSLTDSSTSAEGLKGIMMAFQNEVVLSNSSGIPSEMQFYFTVVTLSNAVLGFLDFTYFGNNFERDVELLDQWLTRVTILNNVLKGDRTMKSSTYEEYVKKYEAKVGPSSVPQNWLSPAQTNFSKHYLDTLFNSSSDMVLKGADKAILLLLGLRSNGLDMAVQNGGNTTTSSFPLRESSFWWIAISDCSEAMWSVCKGWVRTVLDASKQDTGYVGLYYGIQSRVLEEPAYDYRDDYFSKSKNPNLWDRLMAVKENYDPSNVFCFPQSLIKCDSPSADQCRSADVPFGGYPSPPTLKIILEMEYDSVLTAQQVNEAKIAIKEAAVSTSGISSDKITVTKFSLKQRRRHLLKVSYEIEIIYQLENREMAQTIDDTELINQIETATNAIVSLISSTIVEDSPEIPPPVVSPVASPTKAPTHACTTIGGTAKQGSLCRLPFQYKGYIFSTCTKGDKAGSLFTFNSWCSTTFDYSGSWGYCNCQTVNLTGVTVSKSHRKISLKVNYGDEALTENYIVEEKKRIKQTAAQVAGFPEDRIEVSITTFDGEYNVTIIYRYVNNAQAIEDNGMENLVRQIMRGNEKIQSIPQSVIEIIEPSDFEPSDFDHDSNRIVEIKKSSVLWIILIMVAIFLCALVTYKMMLLSRTGKRKSTGNEEEIQSSKFQA